MYAALYQYLIQYKQLSIPGIGSISLNRRPAWLDFPARLIHAPSYQFSFDRREHPSSTRFFDWLGSRLDIPEEEANLRFNDFIGDLKQQIKEGRTIHWKGVGSINQDVNNEIAFIPDTIIPEQPVTADKIVREKAEHTVMVGEEERSSEEMTAFLNQPAKQKSTWWMIPAVLILISIMFIGWYFSEHGVEIATTSNTKLIIPGEADTSYRLLP